MSNIDTAIYTSDELLFSELTPEEGAVIEGGATLRLIRATAIRASADVFPGINGDDVYIKCNGNKIYGTNNNVKTGDTFSIGKSYQFSGTASIRFFDADVLSDDPLGGFIVGSNPTGIKSAIISGSGSTYEVYYKVTAV
ncbi:hypothetical protein IQ277_02305 [Nostocales cyanobacterium LEGE 12452]|nr:hypothetical protein [Nostocales cyanobacterium LEGE 12452]